MLQDATHTAATLKVTCPASLLLTLAEAPSSMANVDESCGAPHTALPTWLQPGARVSVVGRLAAAAGKSGTTTIANDPSTSDTTTTAVHPREPAVTAATWPGTTCTATTTATTNRVGTGASSGAGSAGDSQQCCRPSALKARKVGLSVCVGLMVVYGSVGEPLVAW